MFHGALVHAFLLDVYLEVELQGHKVGMPLFNFTRQC